MVYTPGRNERHRGKQGYVAVGYPGKVVYYAGKQRCAGGLNYQKSGGERRGYRQHGVGEALLHGAANAALHKLQHAYIARGGKLALVYVGVAVFVFKYYYVLPRAAYQLLYEGGLARTEEP